MASTLSRKCDQPGCLGFTSASPHRCFRTFYDSTNPHYVQFLRRLPLASSVPYSGGGDRTVSYELMCYALQNVPRQQAMFLTAAHALLYQIHVHALPRMASPAPQGLPLHLPAAQTALFVMVRDVLSDTLVGLVTALVADYEERSSQLVQPLLGTFGTLVRFDVVDASHEGVAKSAVERLRALFAYANEQMDVLRRLVPKASLPRIVLRESFDLLSFTTLDVVMASL